MPRLLKHILKLSVQDQQKIHDAAAKIRAENLNSLKDVNGSDQRNGT